MRVGVKRDHISLDVTVRTLGEMRSLCSVLSREEIGLDLPCYRRTVERHWEKQGN